MNVLWLAGWLDGWTTGRRMVELLERWDTRAHPVRVVCWGVDDYVASALRRLGVDCHSLPAGAQRNVARRLTWLRAVANRPADVWHVWSDGEAMWSALAALWLRPPVVLGNGGDRSRSRAVCPPAQTNCPPALTTGEPGASAPWSESPKPFAALNRGLTPPARQLARRTIASSPHEAAYCEALTSALRLLGSHETAPLDSSRPPAVDRRSRPAAASGGRIVALSGLRDGCRVEHLIWSLALLRHNFPDTTLDICGVGPARRRLIEFARVTETRGVEMVTDARLWPEVARRATCVWISDEEPAFEPLAAELLERRLPVVVADSAWGRGLARQNPLVHVIPAGRAGRSQLARLTTQWLTAHRAAVARDRCG